MTSPEPPAHFVDFWDAAYGAGGRRLNRRSLGAAATLNFPAHKGDSGMYKVLVVGTDGSERADRAVAAAAEIARSWGSELHIVTATRAPRASAAAASAMGAPLIETGAEKALAEESAKNVGEEAVRKHGAGLAAEAHGVQGNPDDVLLSTAAEVGADLIVVGSKGMRGARRYLGSVPNSIAHGAHCAVLIVKTD
jgi:nucleotide-binding universal stress UspA family protein